MSFRLRNGKPLKAAIPRKESRIKSPGPLQDAVENPGAIRGATGYRRNKHFYQTKPEEILHKYDEPRQFPRKPINRSPGRSRSFSSLHPPSFGVFVSVQGVFHPTATESAHAGPDDIPVEKLGSREGPTGCSNIIRKHPGIHKTNADGTRSDQWRIGGN